MVIPAEARVQFGRRIAALKRLVDCDLESAEAVASALVYVWTQRVQPNLAPKRTPNKAGELVVDPRVVTFVDWLATLEKFEEAAYWIATAYAILVGDKVRKQRALYFTHPVLAGRVIDALLAQGASLTDDHWHDPACGGAAFLVPVALRMSKALQERGLPAREIVHQISKNLSGNDTSNALIRLSKAFLNLALAPLLHAAGQPLKVRITEGDGLRKWRGASRPAVVICNPPYRKLSAEEAAPYRGRYKYALQGQPNIYALFMEQSLQLVAPGGLVGLLTPTSYLTGPYFSNLRKHVCAVAKVHSVDLLGNRSATFLNVEQETAIATMRTTTAQKGQESRVSVWTETEFEEIGVIRLRNDGGPWVLPRSVKDKSLLSLSAKSPHRLKDYGYTPRIGSMVAYRSARVTYKTYRGCGESLVVPLIWATDITPQGTFVHGRRHHRSHRAEEAFIEVPSKECAGVLTRPAVLLQRLTSTDQTRRLVAAALPETLLARHMAYVCENHVIALLQAQNSSWTPQEMAAILQTNLVDRLYRALSGSSNVGAYELRELPLPCPRKLRAHLISGHDLESAIRKAFK